MGRGYSSSGGRFGGRSYGGYRATGDHGYGASGAEGEVTLEGSVPERSMRHLIEDVAAAHPAVHDVDNRISVRRS